MKIALISLAKGSGCPPIGLVYLATYIKKLWHDIEVEIIDGNFTDDVPLMGWDIIGISAMTVHYDKAIEMGRFIKEMNPKVKVVIGGVHISTCEASYDPKAFDAKVVGEGEIAFAELVNNFIKHGRIASHYEKNNMVDIDNIPRPDWDLVDQRYFDNKPNMTFGEYGVSGVMLTSRGCPYKCVFCSTQKMWGNKVRFHSADYVVGMIQDLDRKGANLIQIWDDLFTINRSRLQQLARLLKQTGMKFNCQPRTDLIDDELCGILKDIGVTTCLFGFESGSDRVLRYLKNNTTTVGQNIEAIRCCHRNGLKVQGSVMLGSPGETLSDMECTVDFVKKAIGMGVQRIWSFVATPFPATEWWKPIFSELEWSRLSHHAQPLLSEVHFWDFNKIMKRLKRIEIIFQIKKAISFLTKWRTYGRFLQSRG